jgi:hypothetical protein
MCTALALLVVGDCSERQQLMQGDDEDDAGMASWDTSAQQRPYVTGKSDGMVSRSQYSYRACPADN